MLYPADSPTPRQGITDQRNEYRLADRAVGGEALSFYVEMAANAMFGTGQGIMPPDENRYFTLRAVRGCVGGVAAAAEDVRGAGALLGVFGWGGEGQRGAPARGAPA
jgi:alpha-mannosidase